MVGLETEHLAATAMAAGEFRVDHFSASAWDSHRAIITDLYQTRNMPLIEVMEYMASRHGFKATMKMYKYRLKSWNLRKNLRHRDVDEFVRSNKAPQIRGAEASQQRIDKYLQQRRRRKRTAKKHDQASQHVNTLYDDQKTDGAPSMALSVVANKFRLHEPSLFSPRSPDDLSLLEGSIHAMRSYTWGNFDSKIWVLDSRGNLNMRDHALEWHATWYTVRHLMDAGRAKQAFRVVQKCNKVFEEILVSNSPRFFSSAFLVFLDLSSRWPDLAASILRYMYSLCRIKFRESNHPLLIFLSNICKLGIGELSQYAKTLANASITILHEFFPLHSRTHVEIVVDTARELFHLGIINGDSAVLQILTIIRQLEAAEVDLYIILSAKRELTYVYLWKKDYANALQLVSEILLTTNRADVYGDFAKSSTIRELIEGTYNEVVSYRLLYQIHRALENHQEALSACQKAAELCVKLYGLADDFTVNNLASYENYLRECGNDDEADQVKGTLKGAMDELCSGIEELTLD